MYINIISNESKTIHVFFILIMLHLLYTSTLYSQPHIGGVINGYSAIESIESQNTVKVTDTSPFQTGDTVLLIQMKGLGVDIDPGNYGIQQDINTAGNYEFLLIDNIVDDIISFSRNMINQYEAFETVQLVKVRGYESARVTSTLEAEQWDGKKGGVIVLIVTDTLFLEANIDVSGKGFRGGEPVDLLDENCADSNPAYQDFSFPEGSVLAGRKGENPATYYKSGEDNIPLASDFVHGRGSIATGGGGGNGLFAGGGGGSNFSQGGFGGRESDNCPETGTDLEAQGGTQLADLLFESDGSTINRFFMGGGGGGSTQYGDRQASHGGNGGGLIIIVVNNIVGTSQYGMFANGDSASIASAGAGGGGGGGSIAVSADNYAGTINMYANGGKGGDVSHEIIAGPGGGGGEGTIVHSESTLPGSVSTFLSVGIAGVNKMNDDDSHGSTPGSPVPGEPGVPKKGIIPNLEINLNGFLFNDINTTRHTICEGTAPEILAGTNPRGGEGTYYYNWLQKTGESAWTEITGANEINYQPGPLSETTQFIRVVTDEGSPVVTDTSRALTIIVQPAITGNIFDTGQTICEGAEPAEITGPSDITGGTNIFEYIWLQSPAPQTQWTEAENDHEGMNYLPPALFDSTRYVRVAFSGECVDTSDIITINVHQDITNNFLEDDQTICENDTPQPVPSSVTNELEGGDGSYIYSWEINTSGIWNMIDENGDDFYYEPGPLTDTIRLRRTVESGACVDTSPPYTINVLEMITMNNISGNQTICYMESPELFTGTEPTGGDGNFRYSWEVSSSDQESWTVIEDNSISMNYQSPPLSDISYFRRIVYSGLNDACKDTTSAVQVNLHPFSYATIIESHDTICMGEQTEISFSLMSEDSPYEWTLVFSDGENDFPINEIETELHIEPLNPGTTDSTTYSYHIASLTDKYGCSAPDENFSGTATVRVYAYPQPDPGFDNSVCGTVAELNATPSFGRGFWDAESVTAEFIPDAARPDPEVIVQEYGSHQFKWTETNWQCQADAGILVTFYEQPSNVLAGDDQNIQFIFETWMDAELPGGMQEAYGVWELVEGNGNILSPGEPDTKISEMAFGDNVFMWTVTNGVCEPVSDMVTITVRNLDSPTGFSPNNNGFNDRFVIKGLENSSSNELTIFNRQGNVVYRAVNYNNDWEGRNQSGVPLPEDTYYYILSIDNKYSYKGFIVLKRF